MLGGLGAAFGTLGSAAAGTVGTGFIGAAGNALGIGASSFSPFAIGANAAMAGGGIAATIGAALPVIGIGLALFSLFGGRSKPPISKEDFRAIQTGLDLTGQRLFDTGRSGQRMAAHLKDAAGGIDDFTDQTEAYYGAFFTEEEKRQRAIENITAVFDDLKIAVPRTAEQFRQTVEGLDLTTRAGREAYAQLMQVSEAFAAVYGGAGSASQQLRQMFGGAVFRTATDEALATAAIDGGADLSFLNVAGGVIRPDERLRLSAPGSGLSAGDQATVDLSILEVLQSLERTVTRWEAAGVPSREEAASAG
jgi:hypothetical protein